MNLIMKMFEIFVVRESESLFVFILMIGLFIMFFWFVIKIDGFELLMVFSVVGFCIYRICNFFVFWWVNMVVLFLWIV